MTGSYEPPDHLKLQSDDEQEQASRRQQRLRWESDFKFILGRKEGRRFIWWLLSITGLHFTPFRGAAREETDFLCGKQHVGLELQAKIHELCPERYFEMVKEQQDDERHTRS